jgi:hypothetical protein
MEAHRIERDQQRQRAAGGILRVVLIPPSDVIC